MRRIVDFTRLAGRFARNRRGNFGVMMAATVSLLGLSVGFALNTGQMYLVHSNLQNALDSAVTSTARDLTLGVITEKDARDSVMAFLDANGGSGFVAADQIKLNSLVINKTKKTVEASVSVDLALAIPLFRTGPTQRIATESAAVYSDKTIEVAMMLDVTGSMGGRTNKLKDLQTAAKNAVDTLLGGQNSKNPRVRVSIVPYATSVNVGSALANTVYVEKTFTTGEPPKQGDPILVSGGGGRPDNCATERKGKYQFSDAGPHKAMVNRDYRLGYCPNAALKPLTGDITSLKNTINGFTANGYTAGHIGIQWTWYMLSPQWRNVLPVASAPRKYNNKKTAKIAILMTDGEFNTAYAGVGAGTETDGHQARLSRRYAERLCAKMKKKGIDVYTIGFMLKEASAKGVMKKCASKDTGGVQHYFEAANGAALNAAFQEIAANIERLALTK